MLKRGPQEREKKTLSASGLLKKVSKVFAEELASKKYSRGKKREISLKDSMMSALAMFSLKSPSLLAFDQARKSKAISNNLKKLYGIEHVPSDTYMREELDDVDPMVARKAFLSLFEAVQRNKLLEKYQFLGGYLILADGTEVFHSDSVQCDHCCSRKHHDGRKTYYHQILEAVIVHPDYHQVIPFCPEPISKQDGATKNDCEQNAMKRFLPSLKKEHPRLSATIVYDALAANTPQINEIKSFGYHFIINVKPGNNKSLFDFISGAELEEVKIILGKNNYTFRFINDIPLNDAQDTPQVNFLECKASEVKGGKIIEKYFTWVTDHHITKNNVVLIMRGGRVRWKIENETFNTLKNQGYQLEHNFGHGYKNLFSIFAMLMILAFLIDQIQEAACGLFQAALQKMVSRRALWEMMRSFFYICLVNSWEELFTAVTLNPGIPLSFNSS